MQYRTVMEPIDLSLTPTRTAGISADRFVLDHSYPFSDTGHIYTSPHLVRGYTVRHLGVVLLTADHAPFVVCQQGHPDVETNAVAVAPMVMRRLSAPHVPLLSLNIYPGHRHYRAFGGVRRMGFVQLERAAFGHLDDSMCELVKGAASLASAQALFEEVVSLTAEQLPRPPREDPRAAALRELVESNPGMSIADLAAYYGLSRRTITRLFSAAVGISMRDYKDFMRCRQLTGLLHTNQSLTEVALNSGFGGSPQLSHAFRRWFDQSPSSMRNQHKVIIHRPDRVPGEKSS